MKNQIIDETIIREMLNENSSVQEIDSILKKAEKKEGLTLVDAAKLLNIEDEEELKKLFDTAKKVKMEIYGPRIVLFAPLYCSSFCINDCEYCAFHKRNDVDRKKLTCCEIEEEVKVLEDMGHKRLLLEFGEHPLMNPIDYVVNSIDTIYKTKNNKGEIRRVNVNIAATSADHYKQLKDAGIGTYQLFQETYHRPTYDKVHNGPKADFDRQLYAIDRAFEAGIDDLGIGVLFGLYDYKFEVLAMLQHAQYMDEELGVGPHTISVPRFQPAETVDFVPEYPVSDEDFLKLIAVLRLSVPYTGMIISTRETPEIRRRAFDVGISQASAGSKTEPGAYKKGEAKKMSAQFNLNDHRSMDDIVQDICRLGYLPSFCTACYRTGRTGDRFMELAKSGEIGNICGPNAILTFKEYLLDYASPETRKIGEDTIKKQLEDIMDEKIKKQTLDRLSKIEAGERDLYF